MNLVIETTGLSFAYRGTPVLSGINFQAEKGDFIGIIGANGTGKSTFLRLITGLLSPETGEIRLFGKDIKNFRDFSRLAYISQKANLLNGSFPANVLEFVMTGLAGKGLFRPYRKREHSHALECLETVSLSEHSFKQIGELSGGQLQRALIARALVSNPELMILDEPTVGIDSRSVEYICCLLARLREERGITIIMVTHDLPSVVTHANKLFVFSENGDAHMKENTGLLDISDMAGEEKHSH